MRKAINENPKVQMGVVGALILIAGLLIVMRMGGSEAEPDTVPPNAPIGTDPSAVPDATGVTAGTSAPTGGAVATDAAAPVPTASSAPPAADPATVSPEALVPGKGLPGPVKAAWDRGDAIVLLVIRPGSTDDRLVRIILDTVSEPRTSVFVVKAKNIARYSRVTQGVGVTRVPALVVVRPRRISGPVPEAQVSYGFRGRQSIVQAIHDALYKGPDDLPYNPG